MSSRRHAGSGPAPSAGGGAPAGMVSSAAARANEAASERAVRSIRGEPRRGAAGPSAAGVGHAPYHPAVPRADPQTRSPLPATALTRAIAAALVAAIIIAACDNPSPTPSPAATTSSTPGASAGPSPTVQPSATAVAASEFPLAVVTGLTNLKAVVSVDEIG